jgi:glutaredoxin-like YruB-family protein
MITIYTTPTCAFCSAVKQYLREKGHEYKEKDLTTDEEATKWVMEKTGQLAVPVTDINGDVIVGFDKPKLDKALTKKN